MSRYFTEQYCTALSCNALRALLWEACLSPKPGLVDTHNNGAHRDMNLLTFMDNSAVLSGHFYKLARIGLNSASLSPQALFARLRIPGMHVETEMLATIGGASTHKSAIFSLGMLCASLSSQRSVLGRGAAPIFWPSHT